MIGTVGAAWLMFLLFASIGAMGMLVGLIMSVTARRRWTGQVAWTDAAVSLIAAVVLGCIIYKVENAHGNWESHNGLIIVLALGMVVLKHGFQLVSTCRKSS
jgi:hypothetical protein